MSYKKKQKKQAFSYKTKQAIEKTYALPNVLASTLMVFDGFFDLDKLIKINKYFNSLFCEVIKQRTKGINIYNSLTSNNTYHNTIILYLLNTHMDLSISVLLTKYPIMLADMSR